MILDHRSAPADIARAIKENLPKLLVLHFDVNETLLISDAAGGDTHAESLNKIIAKSAFCRIPLDQQHLPLREVVPEQWMDGSPIVNDGDLNDVVGESCWQNLHTDWEWPTGCCPYYKTSFKKHAKMFTEHPHGRSFKPIRDAIKEKMRVFGSSKGDRLLQESYVDRRISHDGTDHYILPAFFECLYQLLSGDNSKYIQRIRIVIRTFGSDLSEIKDAINAFAEGRHPYYPDFQCPELVLLDKCLFRGRWVNNSCGDISLVDYQLNEWTSGDTDYDTPVEKLTGRLVAKGDKAVTELIEGKDDAGFQISSSIEMNEENCSIICGIQDDYNHWFKNHYAPSAGKPVWIRVQESGAHHVFFDDNIHNDASDSIVSVRSELEKQPRMFRSLSGEEILQTHGKHIVRVPTVEPSLYQGWFLSKILTSLKQI